MVNKYYARGGAPIIINHDLLLSGFLAWLKRLKISI